MERDKLSLSDAEAIERIKRLLTIVCHICRQKTVRNKGDICKRLKCIIIHNANEMTRGETEDDYDLFNNK